MTLSAHTNRSESVPILIIEDEPSVTAFLRAALERGGYRVVPATSGREGLRLLETGEYLGVISDVRTPGGISGADVQAWLHAHRPELRSRLIFITGDTHHGETAALLASTGAPCVAKPFRVQQLMAVVEKTFGKP